MEFLFLCSTIEEKFYIYQRPCIILYIFTHTHTRTRIYIYSRTVRTHFQKRSNFENIYFNKVLKVYISFLWEKKRYQYTCFQICNVFENRCIILCVSIYNFL